MMITMTIITTLILALDRRAMSFSFPIWIERKHGLQSGNCSSNLSLFPLSPHL